MALGKFISPDGLRMEQVLEESRDSRGFRQCWYLQFSRESTEEEFKVSKFDPDGRIFHDSFENFRASKRYGKWIEEEV